MFLRSFVATHISRLHSSMVAHMHDPYSKFHAITALTRRLFMVTTHGRPLCRVQDPLAWLYEDGDPGLDGPRFQPHRSWVTITIELLRREEFE